MRRALWLGLAALGIPVMACIGLLGPIAMSFPNHQGPRVEGAGVVGIDADGAYAWVVPTDTGVVLVDTGLDPTAAALKAEIGDRTVHAVLITHAHLDHIRGLEAFPGVPVHVGPGEAVLVTGEQQPQGQIQSWFGSVMGELPPTPTSLEEVQHGDVLAIDGHRFGAVHVPGHTPGSTAWLWGEVLFSGDTLLGHGDHVAPTHASFADDWEQNVASIERLTHHRFLFMADGHAGLHADAAPQVHQFVADHP